MKFTLFITGRHSLMTLIDILVKIFSQFLRIFLKTYDMTMLRGKGNEISIGV